MIKNPVPSEWSLSVLGDVVEVIRGITYKKTQASDEPNSDLLPILRANNIQAGKIVATELKYIPKDLVKPHQKLLYGDIIVAMSSGSKAVVGKAAQINDRFEGSFGAFCGALRPLKHCDSSYLSWFTHSLGYRSRVSTLSAGANINNLKPSHFGEIEIPIAPLAEQKVIADKLDTLLAQVDSTKTRLERIPEILKRFRQSVLAAAVSGRLTEEWRSTNQDIEIADTYSVPSDWVSIKLDELSEFVTSGSRGWAKYYSNEGALFIRSQDINTDELDVSDPCYVSLPNNIEGQRTKVQESDLLLTITGANVTKCARVKESIDNAFVSQHVSLIRLKDPSVSCFVELVLKAPNAGRYQLLKAAYGGGKPGLNLQNIKNVVLALPEPDEMAVAIRRVDQLFTYADNVERQVNSALERVNQLTQSILAKAFRGEMTAQWREDHPELISGDNSAEALLERIKAERAAKAPVKRTRKKATA